MRKNVNFYLACLAEGTGLRLVLSETQKTGFIALWLDSSRTNISSATDNNIKTNIMRRPFFRYINRITLFDGVLHRLTQVIRNYGPQSRGTAGALIFWLQVSGMTLYYQRICPSCAWLQMNGAHNFFCLYAPVICEQPHLRGMSRTLTLCLQFPIVTTIMWGQLAGKP